MPRGQLNEGKRNFELGRDTDGLLEILQQYRLLNYQIKHGTAVHEQTFTTLPGDIKEVTLAIFQIKIKVGKDCCNSLNVLCARDRSKFYMMILAATILN